jgi:hypothetical protein
MGEKASGGRGELVRFVARRVEALMGGVGAGEVGGGVGGVGEVAAWGLGDGADGGVLEV